MGKSQAPRVLNEFEGGDARREEEVGK